MLEVLKINVIQPLSARIGTIAATVLIGYGIEAPLANQVAVGVTAFGLILADLVVSYINRKRLLK